MQWEFIWGDYINERFWLTYWYTRTKYRQIEQWKILYSSNGLLGLPWYGEVNILFYTMIVLMLPVTTKSKASGSR